MLEPLDQDIKCADGSTKSFVLSKFPAIDGREIVTQYPTSGLPKLGDYSTNEALMLKIMAFVGVRMPDGTVLRLSTRALVNNHVPEFETLMKLEWAMMRYNCSFFSNGEASSFLAGLTAKVQQSITRTLTDLLPQLLEAVKPVTKNSSKK